MTRALLFNMVFLLVPGFALATPCTASAFYDGFSGQFFGTNLVSGFIYGLDETFLYVTFNTGDIYGYINVPQQTAQNFNYSKTPDTFYTTQIVPIYSETLMTEDCSNIDTEDGIDLTL